MQQNYSTRKKKPKKIGFSKVIGFTLRNTCTIFHLIHIFVHFSISNPSSDKGLPLSSVTWRFLSERRSAQGHGSWNPAASIFLKDKQKGWGHHYWLVGATYLVNGDSWWLMVMNYLVNDGKWWLIIWLVVYQNPSERKNMTNRQLGWWNSQW